MILPEHFQWTFTPRQRHGRAAARLERYAAACSGDSGSKWLNQTPDLKHGGKVGENRMFPNKRRNKNWPKQPLKYGNAPIATADHRSLFVRMCIMKWCEVRNNTPLLQGAMATVALWAADLVRSKRRHLHYLNSGPTGAHSDSVFHRNASRCIIFCLLFVYMKPYTCPNYLDRFTMTSNAKVSFVIRVTNDE